MRKAFLISVSLEENVAKQTITVIPGLVDFFSVELIRFAGSVLKMSLIAKIEDGVQNKAV